MKIMFAITHVGRGGLRQLTFGNQGRNHYDDREKAEAALVEYRKLYGLPRVLSPTEVATLEVCEIECYDHGDAVGIYL